MDTARWQTHIELARHEPKTDEEAVRDLPIRYQTAVDTREFDLLRSILAPDILVDHPHTGSKVSGIEGVVEYLKGRDRNRASQGKAAKLQRHHITNMLSQISPNGVEASSACYYLAIGLFEDNSSLMFGGLFTFKLRKVDGKWKISYIMINRDFDTEITNMKERGYGKELAKI